MYRISVISAIELSSIATLIMIVFLTTNIIEHKSEGNGPYPNLSMYKLKMVKFKKIIFQHVDESSLLIRVPFIRSKLSKPNYHIECESCKKNENVG